MEQHNIERKSQKGFTLIELIAVIVILGILAATVAPRYFDMSGDAKAGAAQGAVAEIVARYNQAMGKFLLANSTVPSTAAGYTAVSGHMGGNASTATVDLGDYSVAYTVGANGLSITNVYDADGTTEITDADGNPITKTVGMPETN